jgi:thiol-disulfide isomerase/thioredoxin
MRSPWVYKGNKILFGELQKKLKDHSSGGVSGIVRFSDKERAITGNFYHDLIQRYQGKVIYLDFWETSCGPCLAQIPYEIKLHEFFRGKPVVLVPVCLNSSKEDWLKKVKNMHIPGENYYLSQKQSQIVSSNLKIQGFPTFMIINKKGRLVDRNAPRPENSKKIKAELMKYLNE